MHSSTGAGTRRDIFLSDLGEDLTNGEVTSECAALVEHALADFGEDEEEKVLECLDGSFGDFFLAPALAEGLQARAALAASNSRR